MHETITTLTRSADIVCCMPTLYFLQTISLLGKHPAAFNVIPLKQITALLAHYQGLVRNKYKKF